VVFGCVALIILVADQLSKTWIRANLAPGESLLDTGLFRIIHIQNSGAAFGILKDYTQVLIVVAFIGIAVILLYVFYLQRRWHILDNMFVMGALGLVLGAVWGRSAWGDYWNWDPKELWSLVTWLIYLGYLHFRHMYGTRHARINSMLAIAGSLAIIITLLWVNLSRLFPGLHSYAS